MLGTILIIILILLLLGSLPTWPYSGGWGYYPSGGAGLILLIVIILLVAGRLGDVLRLHPVQRVDHAVRVGAPGGELDAGVEILRVLADDHHVDALVARAHAGIGLNFAPSDPLSVLRSSPEIDTQKFVKGVSQ